MLIMRLVISSGEFETIIRNYKPGAEFRLIVCWFDAWL